MSLLSVTAKYSKLMCTVYSQALGLAVCARSSGSFDEDKPLNITESTLGQFKGKAMEHSHQDLRTVMCKCRNSDDSVISVEGCRFGTGCSGRL